VFRRGLGVFGADSSLRFHRMMTLRKPRKSTFRRPFKKLWKMASQDSLTSSQGYEDGDDHPPDGQGTPPGQKPQGRPRLAPLDRSGCTRGQEDDGIQLTPRDALISAPPPTPPYATRPHTVSTRMRDPGPPLAIRHRHRSCEGGQAGMDAGMAASAPFCTCASLVGCRWRKN